MKDKISENRVSLLHPKIKNEVKSIIEEIEEKQFPSFIAIRIVQGLRTIEEQNNLYALGRTKKNPDGASSSKPMGNIVTNAKGGSSYHNYGLAIDFAILYDIDKNGNYETLSWNLVKDLDRDGQADWMEVVTTFKKYGYEWGGDWHSIKDNPHLQKSFGYSWQNLYKKYKNKEFIPQSDVYLNI